MPVSDYDLKKLLDALRTLGTISIPEAAKILHTNESKTLEFLKKCEKTCVRDSLVYYQHPFDLPCRNIHELSALLQLFFPYGIRFMQFYGCYEHIFTDLESLVFAKKVFKLEIEHDVLFFWSPPRAHATQLARNLLTEMALGDE